MTKVKIFCIFLQKNLVISKKSSTFAPAFDRKVKSKHCDAASIAQLVEH